MWVSASQSISLFLEMAQPFRWQGSNDPVYKDAQQWVQNASDLSLAHCTQLPLRSAVTSELLYPVMWQGSDTRPMRLSSSSSLTKGFIFQLRWDSPTPCPQLLDTVGSPVRFTQWTWHLVSQSGRSWDVKDWGVKVEVKVGEHQKKIKSINHRGEMEFYWDHLSKMCVN